MKFNDERTGLIGLAIGAAVIGLISGGKIINRDNIIEEIERQGRNRGDGVRMPFRAGGESGNEREIKSTILSGVT
jgi:hypothetical protein